MASLTRIDLRGCDTGAFGELLPKLSLDDAFPTEPVRNILAEVRRGGDEAIRGLTQRFDRVTVDHVRVGNGDVRSSLSRIDPGLARALANAFERITAYHSHDRHLPGTFKSGGMSVDHLVRPVSRAGMYAPGGRAKYPSTVLMCAAPARVAGVGELVLCVPPGPGGRVADETLAAAAVAGVDEVYAVGGAQAIAAMAYGTESISPVDVIVGPGNSFVAEAKRQVSGVVGVPSAFAGPSEVVVVADGSSPSSYAAIDLVVQAEHVDRMVEASGRRQDLESTMSRGGFAVLVDGLESAMAVVNHVAPEHLELQVEDERRAVELVKNAGAVFVGPYSPASVGDYIAGTNHVLPTARTARFSSALSVHDFCKTIHVVSMERQELCTLADDAVIMATAEGLEAHADSIRMRFAPVETGKP